MINSRIELSEKQLILIPSSMEEILRFDSRDRNLNYTINKILNVLPFEERLTKRDTIQKLLSGVKKILFPELKINQRDYYNANSLQVIYTKFTDYITSNIKR